MPVNRFFFETPLQLKSTIFIEGEEFEHMRVLRLKEGENFELVNGKNEIAFARLLEIEKKRARVEIESLEKKDPPPFRSLLALGTPKTPKLEFILEKGTELGITEFWLFPAELSEKNSFSPSQKQRQRHILISALKQCGRFELPLIRELSSLSELPPFDGRFFFGDTRENAPSFLSQVPFKPLGSALFFIGPEKGFTSKEIFFLQSNYKAVGVKLAPYILRTETAGISAATLIAALQLSS